MDKLKKLPQFFVKMSFIVQCRLNQSQLDNVNFMIRRYREKKNTGIIFTPNMGKIDQTILLIKAVKPKNTLIIFENVMSAHVWMNMVKHCKSEESSEMENECEFERISVYSKAKLEQKFIDINKTQWDLVIYSDIDFDDIFYEILSNINMSPSGVRMVYSEYFIRRKYMISALNVLGANINDNVDTNILSLVADQYIFDA